MDPHIASPGPEVGIHSTLKRRAVMSTFVLAGRAGVLQFIGLVGNVYVARLLEPSDFGIYAIVLFALSFFTLLGDAGLAAGLIQKHGTPSQRELSSVWWLQLALSLVVIGVVWVVAPLMILVWPSIPPQSSWLLRALSFNLFFTAIGVVPSLLLERDLRFARISISEVVTAVVFYVVLISLARRGWGVESFIGAVLSRGLVGSLLILGMRPWRPSLVFDWSALRPILRFGMPFQGKTVVGFLNGAVTPLYGGAVLGSYSLGLNNFARDTAYYPLRLVEIMARVGFPLYSRLRNDERAFASVLGRSIRLCAMGTLFFVALIFGLGPRIVHTVYSQRWDSAVPLLYVYTSTIALGFLSPLVAAALDAAGRPQIVFKLSLGWSLLNWIVVAVVLSFTRTALAFAIAYAVHVVLGNLALLFVTRRLLPLSEMWSWIRASAIAALLTALTGRLLLFNHAVGPVSLGLCLLVEGALFALTIAALDRSEVMKLILLYRSVRGTGISGAPLAPEEQR